MSRKQSNVGISGSLNARSKANISYKENQKFGTYQIDPKIVELKKKYQIGQPQRTNISYLGHRTSTSNMRQQQVLKKLQNIKSQLQSIPDWQYHARSILFNQPTTLQNNIRIDKPKSNYLNQNSKFDTSKILEQNSQDSKIMDVSNVSFKISQSNLIQKSASKTQEGWQGITKPTRSKAVSQYTFDKPKYQIKQYNVSKDNDFGKSNKFDDKINQISRKIIQSQQKKKNLGVQFVPFEKKTPQRRYQSPQPPAQPNFTTSIPQHLLLKNSVSVQKIQNRPPKPPATISSFNFNASTTKQNKIRQKIPQVSPRFAGMPQHKLKDDSFQNKYKLDNQLNKFQWERKNRNYSVNLNSHNISVEKDRKFIDSNLSNINNDRNKIILEKAEQSLKERKKKIVNVEQQKKSKQITQKLVQNLCQQVKLDEKFRNCKLWFKACKSERKLERLKSLLDCEGLKLTQQKITEQFMVLQKQDNPFFSVTSQQCDIEQVAKSYIQSQRNWKKNLYRQFSRNGLEKQDFSNLSIDLDKKGYIVLEDLVRFLNMETGTFFRNRDLFTIFRRISNNSEKVNFNSFINALYA